MQKKRKPIRTILLQGKESRKFEKNQSSLGGFYLGIGQHEEGLKMKRILVNILTGKNLTSLRPLALKYG